MFHGTILAKFCFVEDCLCFYQTYWKGVGQNPIFWSVKCSLFLDRRSAAIISLSHLKKALLLSFNASFRNFLELFLGRVIFAYSYLFIEITFMLFIFTTSTVIRICLIFSLPFTLFTLFPFLTVRFQNLLIFFIKREICNNWPRSFCVLNFMLTLNA